MSKEKIQNIFQKVQMTTSCHQKFIIILTDLYKKTPQEEFLRPFFGVLQVAVCHKIENAVYTKRVLSFASRFCADITKKEEKAHQPHDFLTAVMTKTLEWSCLNTYDIRFNSCFFIASVLQDIGDEVELEISLIDDIQTALLERMLELKTPIRVVVMSALVRLQDPLQSNCPVIETYKEALLSASAHIRRNAVDQIAPTNATLKKIIERVRDCDPGVRSAAFHKCADIGPLIIPIVDRITILMCGFGETDGKPKNNFFDYLLPKWLTSYQGNFLKFVGALRLVVVEEDINKVMSVGKELIKAFYNKHPIDELIAVLPLDEEKFINVASLSNDVTLFWNSLSSLLRESDNMDEYLNRVLPDLTAFCMYIDKVIKTRSTEKMDEEWKFLEYQFDLFNLFEIAENYDYSDEVGRRTMHSLTASILQNNTFILKLTRKLVLIAQKCSSNIEFFTTEICQLISEIREPVIEEPLTDDGRRERQFKEAELRLKIDIAKERQNEAVNERDYKQAQHLDNQLRDYNIQLEDIRSHLGSEKVRVTRSDNDTLCHCLDILSCVLELPAVNKMTPSLITCRDYFLIPLISNQAPEVHWRVLRCLALFSLIDRVTAEEYAKIICIPIATYRTIPITNVQALVQSMCSVTDLISVYGYEIVGQKEEVANNTSEQNGTKRKLYRESEHESATVRIDNMTLSYILEIFLDMLDDERYEIRSKAILAIGGLVSHNIPITPTLLSRILLKWYSPILRPPGVPTDEDNRFQIYLGMLLDDILKTRKIGEVIKDAIVPTLTSIVRAPRTSPLVDIDVDNVLMFFSEMSNIHLPKDDIRILVLDLCMKISENITDRVVPYLIKILCHLEFDSTATPELIQRVEMLLENISERVSRRHLEKLILKMKQIPQRNSTVQTGENTTLESNQNANSEQPGNVLQEVVIDNEHNTMQEPQQVKRRKSRISRSCVVRLEKLNLSEVNQTAANDTRKNCANETTLHTIIENSMEVETSDSLSIDTATSDTSKSSKISTIRTNSVIISETSDSDFSADAEKSRRKSNRCRKKRILQ